MSSNTQRRWSARSLIYARQLIEYNGVIPSGDNEATNAETDQKRVNSKNSGTSSREATMVRALVSPAPLKRNRTSSSSSSSSPCRRMTAQRKRPQRGKAKASALPESANRQKRLRTSHLRRRGTSCTVAPYSPEAPCKPSSCADEDESHNDGGIIHGDAQLFHPSARTRKGNRRGLLEQRVVLQKVTNNDAAAMTATIPAATIAPALSLSGTTNALGRPRRRTKHLFMTQGNVSLQHTTTTPVTPPESDAAAVEALLQLGSSSLRVNRDARRLRGGHGEGLEVGEEEKKQGKATGGGGEDINIAMTTPRTNIPRETEIGNTAGAEEVASNSNIGISVDISISDCYGSIPGATETDMSTYRGRDKRTLSESITLSLPAVIGEKGAGEHDGSGVEAAESGLASAHCGGTSGNSPSSTSSCANLTCREGTGTPTWSTVTSMDIDTGYSSDSQNVDKETGKDGRGFRRSGGGVGGVDPGDVGSDGALDALVLGCRIVSDNRKIILENNKSGPVVLPRENQHTR